MAKFLKPREREALKQLAVGGSDDAVRHRLVSLAPLAEQAGIPWLASPSLPIGAAREALVGIAQWWRHREHGGRENLLAYLGRWAHVIEPEGRTPTPERKNALAAFVAPPAGKVSALSY